MKNKDLQFLIIASLIAVIISAIIIAMITKFSPEDNKADWIILVVVFLLIFLWIVEKSTHRNDYVLGLKIKVSEPDNYLSWKMLDKFNCLSNSIGINLNNGDIPISININGNNKSKLSVEFHNYNAIEGTATYMLEDSLKESELPHYILEYSRLKEPIIELIYL